MNDNTFADDFIIRFVSKHRRVSVMFSDIYLPRGAVSWWIICVSVDHHVKSNEYYVYVLLKLNTSFLYYFKL